MSQSHQRASLPGCPSCEEPLEPGDLFCGACGYDLSAVPAPPADRPTVAVTLPAQGAGAQGAGARQRAGAGGAGPGEWPAAPEGV
ncbi:zinc-ribbon domain-containing protein, partial [Streptomyces sp. NPDC005899]|uniref:zinc-ribbon domain-containing protein n=1 Tax=Streptomyces sp. NPDC005899 TaxID=3155716 RepID=UPI0033D695E1